MASVNVVLTRGSTEARWSGVLPVANSIPIFSDTVTSTAGSVAVNLGAVVPQAVSDVWCFTVSGGAVNVAFGEAATATTQWLILDGQTRWFGVTESGEIPQIIDAV